MGCGEGDLRVFLRLRFLGFAAYWGCEIAAGLGFELAIVLGPARVRLVACGLDRRSCVGLDLVGYSQIHSRLAASDRVFFHLSEGMIVRLLRLIAAGVAQSNFHRCLAASARDFFHRSALMTALPLLHSIAVAVVDSDSVPFS